MQSCAENVGINATFKSDIQQDVRRKVAERSSAFTQSPAHGPGYEFKKTQIFKVLIDCVTVDIRKRFKAAENTE